jgi:pyruvate/2-oxoglutarate dehydrogenase complex dihydrolipoamide dehydrogenase (E3) component
VAIETLGEIKAIYPNKKVTAIYTSNDLYQFAGESARARRVAAGWFDNWGLEHVPNERVVAVKYRGTKGYALGLTSGRIFKADFVLFCTGVTANSEFMRDHFAETLTPSGFINVDEKLLVDKTKYIFAFGDVINFVPLPHIEKLGSRCQEQLFVLIKNLNKAIKGDMETLETYKPWQKMPARSVSVGFENTLMIAWVRIS